MGARRKPEPKRSPRRRTKPSTQRKQTGPPGTPLEVAEAQRSFQGKWHHFGDYLIEHWGATIEPKAKGGFDRAWARSGQNFGSNTTVASSDFGKLERTADRQKRRMRKAKRRPTS